MPTSSLSNPILIGCIYTKALVDNSMMSEIGVTRRVKEFPTIINLKYLNLSLKVETDFE